MNSPALKLALSAAIALLALSSSQASAAATGSISGFIQGEATGDTCVRDVWVYDSTGNRVAGIDGQSTLWNFDDYKIDGLRPGEYRLSFDQYCVDRLGPLPTGGGSSHVCEYFNDSPTLANATPVTVVEGKETTGVDVFLGLGNPVEWEAARISWVTVQGPSKVKKGDRTTQKVKIRNSGDNEATRVQLRIWGRGISYRASVGSIPADTTNVVKVVFAPRKSGKTTVKYRVTSANAGAMSVQRNIVVK
ncbi:MAG: hypothetical protein KDB57_03585 [Solirubrobacterales bacterium]|nr:hypothetical protein [Solirubrobacterales bacterium]